MAEDKIKEIIKAMKEAGMSRGEMAANLQEIGVENPERVIAEVLGEAKPAEAPAPYAAAAPAPTPAAEALAPEEGEEETKPLFEEAAPAEGEMPAIEMPSAIGPSAEELSAKLDEVLALLKALQEVDRQVLATLREVLLRIRQQ